MNIAFVVSSAEPGRDGMGDYSLSLARGLCALGHSVLVIALNDSWISTPYEEGAEDVISPIVERLPSSLSWDERIRRASARLKAFRADWASFQLVSYGYHPKGLLFWLNKRVGTLRDSCENWQVMFQELWVGLEKGSPWKHRLVGFLQKRSIEQFVQTLRPKLLQTSTPFFRAALRRIGFAAQVLPLAGSIPVNPNPGLDWLLSVIRKERFPAPHNPRPAYLAGGFFGSIYGKWQPEPFFATLRAVAKRRGQKVVILSAGRLASGEAIWDKLPASYPDFHFLKLGELSSDCVSEYLQSLDFGIAASPWLLIGKSSATAAMLDHGIPVIVTRNDSRPQHPLDIEPPDNPLLILADYDLGDRFLTGLPRRTPEHSVGKLAAEFVRQLEMLCPASQPGDDREALRLAKP